MLNPRQLLYKYQAINPLTNDDIVNAMLLEASKESAEQQRGAFIRCHDTGIFTLCEDDRYPNKVVEYVMGTDEHGNGDSVSTLYEGNPVFSSLAKLREVRLELIMGIERSFMAVPRATVVEAPGRGRKVHLYELCTAQLVDLLREIATQSSGIISA